jgi:uncharacterized protein (TIGR00106 family)
MGKIIAAVSITPLGTETPSVSKYVAAALRVLEKYKDIQYQTDAMFTILYGEKERVFQAILEMQEAVFDEGAKRVSTMIKIDERRDKDVSPRRKIRELKKMANLISSPLYLFPAGMRSLN